MKCFTVIALCMFSYLGAMDKPAWNVDRLATRMANQRHADDMLYIKKIKEICHKPHSAISPQDEQSLVELAGRYKSFCVLEEACKSSLFKSKEMDRIKNRMLCEAVQVISYGAHNSKRRGRVLENVRVLLESGAGQDERNFEAVMGTCFLYIFRCCGFTEKDFEVRHITKVDHLKLIGLFAKHIKHDGFKNALVQELNETEDRVWALQIANTALENGIEQSLIDKAFHKAIV